MENHDRYSSHPLDVLALYPPMLTTLAKFFSELVTSGIELYPQRVSGTSVYTTSEVSLVWYWRLTQLGVEASIGYPDPHHALLDALVYLISSRHSPDDLSGRVRQDP